MAKEKQKPRISQKPADIFPLMLLKLDHTTFLKIVDIFLNSSLLLLFNASVNSAPLTLIMPLK